MSNGFINRRGEIIVEGYKNSSKSILSECSDGKVVDQIATKQYSTQSLQTQHTNLATYTEKKSLMEQQEETAA